MNHQNDIREVVKEVFHNGVWISNEEYLKQRGAWFK